MVICFNIKLEEEGSKESTILQHVLLKIGRVGEDGVFDESVPHAFEQYESTTLVSYLIF